MIGMPLCHEDWRQLIGFDGNSYVKGAETWERCEYPVKGKHLFLFIKKVSKTGSTIFYENLCMTFFLQKTVYRWILQS